jgi:hypothetical protein
MSFVMNNMSLCLRAYLIIIADDLKLSYKFKKLVNERVLCHMEIYR